MLTLSDSTNGGNWPTISETVTITGGTNAPACSSNFTYTLGAAGAVLFTTNH